MVQIEKRLGQVLPITTLLHASTVERLAAVLSQVYSLPSPTSLGQLQPRGPRPLFFGVHPLGGDFLCFADLARHLAPEQPMYGVRAWRREGTDEPLARIPDMAAHYIMEIRTVQA